MTAENVPAMPSYPRFDAVPYRPDGGCSPVGAVLFIAAVVICGVLLGLLASVIRQWFYLVLLFPVVMGLGLGAVSIWAIKAGKVRSPLLAGVAGFVGGCTAMLAMHYGDYQRFLGHIEQEIPGARQILEADAGGFLHFMNLQAEQGVQIGRARAGNRDNGINLGYAGSFIYWMIEIFIVAGIVYAMAHNTAGEPFCVRCNNWKAPRTLGSLGIGNQEVAQALADGNLTPLHEKLQTPDPLGLTCVLQAAVCDACGTNAAIDVKALEAKQNDKGEFQFAELAHFTYPGEALPVFETLFTLAPPETEPAPPAEETREEPS